MSSSFIEQSSAQSARLSILNMRVRLVYYLTILRLHALTTKRTLAQPSATNRRISHTHTHTPCVLQFSHATTIAALTHARVPAARIACRKLLSASSASRWFVSVPSATFVVVSSRAVESSVVHRLRCVYAFASRASAIFAIRRLLHSNHCARAFSSSSCVCSSVRTSKQVIE